MTQAEKFAKAKLALNLFLAEHGNKALFPSTQKEHALARKLVVLEDAVSDAYWTDEMDAQSVKVVNSIVEADVPQSAIFRDFDERDN